MRHRRDPVAVLMVIGEPAELKSMPQSKMGQLDLRPLPDIAPAFVSLDLYLMTSRNEGYFPIALLEALERGVPVVAPSVGGISTELRDGEGGFLIVKPDDRKPITPELLEACARRVAPVILDPAAWQEQKMKSVALAARLSEGYDAAERFREVVAPWL